MIQNYTRKVHNFISIKYSLNKYSLRNLFAQKPFYRQKKSDETNDIT